MTAKSLRVGQVDRVLLVTVLRSVGDILAQSLLAQSSKIGLSLMGHTEVESTVGDRLVDELKSVVSLGDIKTDVVSVPAELLGRRDQSPLDSLSVSGLVDERVKEHSGGLEWKLVVDGSLGERRHFLLGLFDSIIETRLGGSDEMVEDCLNGRNRSALDRVLVRQKGKSSMGFSRVGDAKINELDDNGLKDGVRGVLESFPTMSAKSAVTRTHDWKTSQRFSNACCWDCAVPRARSSSER